MALILTLRQILAIKKVVTNEVLRYGVLSTERLEDLQDASTQKRQNAAKASGRYGSKRVQDQHFAHELLVNELEDATLQAKAQQFVDEMHDGLEYLVGLPLKDPSPQQLADMIIGCVHQQLFAELRLTGTPQLDFGNRQNYKQASIEERMRRFRPKIYRLLSLA